MWGREEGSNTAVIPHAREKEGADKVELSCVPPHQPSEQDRGAAMLTIAACHVPASRRLGWRCAVQQEREKGEEPTAATLHVPLICHCKSRPWRQEGTDSTRSQRPAKIEK
jgi:hypothetical protein